jgi:hypothetical protein
MNIFTSLFLVYIQPLKKSSGLTSNKIILLFLVPAFVFLLRNIGNINDNKAINDVKNIEGVYLKHHKYRLRDVYPQIQVKTFDGEIKAFHVYFSEGSVVKERLSRLVHGDRLKVAVHKIPEGYVVPLMILINGTEKIVDQTVDRVYMRSEFQIKFQKIMTFYSYIVVLMYLIFPWFKNKRK